MDCALNVSTPCVCAPSWKWLTGGICLESSIIYDVIKLKSL